MLELLTNQAEDGNSEWVVWPGGEATFVAWGTFSGGDCKLQISPDGGTTAIDLDDVLGTAASLSQKGAARVDIPAGILVRANVSGTGSPTPSISAALF